MRKSAYRKIYEAHHGPIPKDDRGRSYEIHHINGNHNDNRIENLKLVTIEEHYAIHKAQGDYVSAFMIAQRMKLSPEELSNIASMSVTMTNARRIEQGTHHFQDKEAARQRNLKRLAEGTHNLTTENNPSTILAKAGKHHFQLNNPVNRLLASGNHASKIKLSCRFCRKTTSKNQFTKLHSTCKEILPVIA